MLGHNKEAVLTVISLFNERGFGQQNFVYIDLPQAVLMKETNKSKGIVLLSIINSMKHHQLLCVFLNERNLMGFSEQNLFDSQQSIKSIAVLLLNSISIDQK